MKLEIEVTDSDYQQLVDIAIDEGLPVIEIARVMLEYAVSSYGAVMRLLERLDTSPVDEEDFDEEFLDGIDL
jgi:hypothetical protein